MPRHLSIDADQGQALINAFKRVGTVAGAAKAVGVGRNAAARFLSGMEREVTQAVAVQRTVAQHAGASLWDTRATLEENYQRCLHLIADAQQLDMQNPKAVSAMAGVIREIRAHVESSMNLARLLISIEEVKAFQDAVLTAIGEADSDTRERIIAKLATRGAVALAAS